jgi:hypothetical protein
MGKDNSMSYFRMSQDPSVIYHELGHVFVSIMMNQRNATYDNLLQTITYNDYYSHLGSLFYDEAGSLNEGIADYFTYMMINRSRFGEWALGRFYNQSRPLDEDDALHMEGISTAPGERLKYPDFVQYDPNSKNYVYEDVHYAGQIVSHYLVALTKQLQNTCSFSHMGSLDTNSKWKYSSYYIFAVLNETLAEIGDLNTFGSDYNPNIGQVNLNQDFSYLWTHSVNTPSYRRFFQLFARNLYHHITINFCPQFSLDDSEYLLDEYGLLLFKDYKDVGYNFDGSKTHSDMINTPFFTPLSSANALLTTVNEGNRRNSILVTKNLIALPDSNDTRPSAYVFDSQSAIRDILNELTFKGANVSTSTGIASVDYNNSNIKISPGEIVGLSLNLVNSSNSPMAGVHVLANDWDHMVLKDPGDPAQNNIGPCIIDSWPLTSEGGFAGTVTDCQDVTKNNAPFIPTAGFYPDDFVSPICLVEMRQDEATMWVSQDEYRQSIGLDLEDHNCLNNPSMSGSLFNPNECLIRFLPGANQSYFSKIDAQKTWAETMKGTNNQEVSFSSSNVLLLEVNKWIPPGTKFSCRFRVNFSNCSNCFDDPSNGNLEYLDYEFSGKDPYEVIRFNFTVNQ